MSDRIRRIKLSPRTLVWLVFLLDFEHLFGRFDTDVALDSSGELQGSNARRQER